MRRLLLLAIALGATGCFPDYSVDTQGGSGGTAGMKRLNTKGVEFAWQVDAFGNPGQSFTVNFDYDFEIDEYEVTVGRYRAWAENGGNNYVVPADKQSLDEGGPFDSDMEWHEEWKTPATNGLYAKGEQACWGTTAGDYGPKTTYEMTDDNYPMTCVNWHQAVAFCASEGKRLPTEVEWLYVASSGGTRPDYPWGKQWESCDDAIINYNADSQPANFCEFPVAVGSASGDRTVDGVADMGGSVFEWVWDSTWLDFGQDWPQGAQHYAGPDVPPTPAQGRLRNGGAYISSVADDRGRNDAFETNFYDSDFYYDAGFRCARSVK